MRKFISLLKKNVFSWKKMEHFYVESLEINHDFNKLFITERGLIHKALIYIFMLYRKHRTHQTQVRYGE